ncbi:MAG TPA: phosphoglucosamine mutase [Thermodesulfovibrionia bacterium]|nr:phosphoglucosamine mutase [Thermodesulfovibrionia bacterium]
MKLFGTDGIRGRANQYPIIPEVALKVGKSAAYVLNQGRSVFLIGKDTRQSCDMLESALAAGISSVGAEVVLTGILPTPGIAFMTRHLRADAGIVISASHNPYYDNGIKFFSGQGYKLPDAVEAEIESLIHDASFSPKGRETGRVVRFDDALSRYVEYVKATFPKELNLHGLKVIVDCANGAAYKAAPAVFQSLGAEVLASHIEPDGKNINESCGSTYLESLRQAVKAHPEHVGIAFDGDADRVILCDDNGGVVDGDKIMGICAAHMKAAGQLKADTVVATVMSNMGLQRFLEEQGIRLIRTKVGDRYVIEAMLEGQFNLGGEQSGHLLFLDHSTTGDGLIAALQVLAVMKNTGKSLSELASAVPVYPQVLVNVTVANKKDVNTIPEVKQAIEQTERALSGKGRVLIRPSGTEPKIRVMVEGQDPAQIEAMAHELARLIKEKMAEN